MQDEEAGVAHWRRLLLWSWALVLALLMLGPALAPGYVLSYDMVWVPDLALRPDFLGVGSGLPRAVPSDAVVAVLDEVVPGMLLQKLMLVGVLVLGGIGAARITAPGSLPAQLVAITIYQWNPFVAERLLIGHWPVLITYAALPWLIEGARTWRESGRLPARLWFLLPLASLSASAGLVAAVALVAFALTRAGRRVGAIVALLAAANAPWVVSGLLHASSALTDPDGARFFALRGEGSLPAPLAALGLGGIWNADVVPDSRTGTLAWVALVFVVALVALGIGDWARRTGRRDVVAFACCWGIGWGIGVLTWALPDQTAWLVANVPGAGLVRDGGRLLALCAPLLAVAAGYGAARLCSRLVPAARPSIVVALVLVPLATMPDAAFGLSGRLSAVDYPQDHARARSAIASAAEEARARRESGDVLLLPLSSYRQPAWNDGHKVLDPLGRYLTPDFLTGDDLYVSGRRIAGEDPRARAAARALALPTPEERAARLRALGIGLVVTDRSAGASPEVAGRSLFSGAGLVVQELRGAPEVVTPRAWPWLMGAAWLAFCVPLLIGLGTAVRRVRNRLSRH